VTAVARRTVEAARRSPNKNDTHARVVRWMKQIIVGVMD
jgi:hypothetical protein